MPLLSKAGCPIWENVGTYLTSPDNAKDKTALSIAISWFKEKKEPITLQSELDPSIIQPMTVEGNSQNLEPNGVNVLVPEPNRIPEYEATKNVLDAEIAECKVEHGDMWVVYFNDNLHMNGPHCDCHPRGNYREIVQRLGIMDELPSESEGSNWSPTKLSQTPRQFFTAFDQALTTQGISLEAVKSAWCAIINAPKETKLKEVYHDLVFPARILLQTPSVGYNVTDLTQ